MSRGSISSGELLLVVLRLLEQRPMPARELLAEIAPLVGPRARVSPGRVLVALGSLEAEGLVEVASDGPDIYRVTREGAEAVARRADAAVPHAARAAGLPAWRSRRPSTHPVDNVAVLFTDIVGSTELLDEVGDDAAHDLRRRHFALLREAIGEHGGREVKSLGDGLMVVHESPQAAAVCGLAMQRAVAGSPDGLALRVGIAAGEAVREDDDYFGRPVVVARRLCDAAAAGDILVSGPVRGLMADSAVVREPLEPIALKGLSEPVAPTLLRVEPLAAAG